MDGYRHSHPGTLADRAYRQISAVGIGTAAAWTLAWGLLGLADLAAVGVAAVLVIAGARHLRLRLDYPRATRISVVACYVLIVAAIVRTGGMDGPFAMTLLILPLGPALALGAAECLRWGGIVLVTGGGLWAWESTVAPLASAVPPGSEGPMRSLAQFSVLVATVLCLYTYGRMHESSRQRLRRSRGELEEAHRELLLSQQQLLVSEKMAALGRLSAGMAHEINSSLAGAINALELARADAEALPEAGARRDELLRELGESLALALTALGKIAAFVRRMRGHASPEEGSARGAFSAAEEACTVLRLLQVSMLDRGVTLQAEVEPGGELCGDPARFGQIVQNLVSNAVDAYEGAPGAVRVRIRGGHGAVLLEVEDDGAGIPEEIRGRIFDHFFTTKGVGRGSGLGLAIVHDLVTKYFGGSIDFHTQVGRGTRFVVRLPAGGGES